MANIKDKIAERYDDWAFGFVDKLHERAERAMGIRVGEHMNVRVRKYPYTTPVVLSDGIAIVPGEKVGVIELLRDLPKISTHDNILLVTLNMYRSVQNSLEELAGLSERNDPRLDGIEAFYGSSHTAGPLARRLGFDVREIEDKNDRIAETIASQLVVFFHSPHKSWLRRWKQVNSKVAQDVYISRNKLIQMHGNGYFY